MALQNWEEQLVVYVAADAQKHSFPISMFEQSIGSKY